MAGAPQPRFDQINLVVRDMKAMVAFYGLLGIEVGDMPPPWDEHHLETGEHTVSLELDSAASATSWNQGWNERGTGAILSFRVDDRDEVDRLCGVLVDAGATVMQPPYDAFWGSRYAIVQDPDGNAVGLMSVPDPDRRSPPPDPPTSA